MTLERLNTKQFADALKDRIDDLRLTNALPEPHLRKLISFKKLIRTINEADIDLCGFLSPNAQVIIYLPKDYSEIYLRNSDLQSAEYNTQVNALDIHADQKTQLLNYDMWTRVRSIEDTYILISNSFPLGDRTQGERHKLVPYDEFTDVEESFTGATKKFKDQVYEDVQPAFYDVHRSRILLDSKVDSDKFVHFIGQLIPEKLDYTQVTHDSWSDYTITTPEIGEEALILGCMYRLMPLGSELRNLFMAEYEREKRKAASRIPVDTSSFTLDSNIGP